MWNVRTQILYEYRIQRGTFTSCHASRRKPEFHLSQMDFFFHAVVGFSQSRKKKKNHITDMNESRRTIRLMAYERLADSPRTCGSSLPDEHPRGGQGGGGLTALQKHRLTRPGFEAPRCLYSVSFMQNLCISTSVPVPLLLCTARQNKYRAPAPRRFLLPVCHTTGVIPCVGGCPSSWNTFFVFFFKQRCMRACASSLEAVDFVLSLSTQQYGGGGRLCRETGR